METLRYIVGSGRSGTTWVQDALARANGLRPVFEPLNPWASEVGWRYAQRALSPDDEHRDLRHFLQEVAAGRDVRLWTKYRQQWHWLLPRRQQPAALSRGPKVLHRWARFLQEMPSLARMATHATPLVKCIWSNLMLEWLARQFDCRIVLIVRHPGAVIESELRNNWNPRFAVERFRADENLHERTGGRYRSLLDREQAPVESLAIRWLVENQWNIEQATRLAVTVVHYEHLSSQEAGTWRLICEALDLPSMPDAAIISRPSQQSARRESAARSSRDKSPRWQTSLGSEQKARIQAILDACGFDLYSMDAALPRMAEAGETGVLKREVAL